MNKLQQFINKIWYEDHFVAKLLLPFSYIYLVIIKIRYFLYKIGILKTHTVTKPIIVVGNIVVGGVGKTPFVIWLVNYLKETGYKPGIVLRGYGGKSRFHPRAITPNCSPQEVGDEAKLLLKRTSVPVVIDPNRPRAVTFLLERHPDCDIIVSDDGLQHYRMDRDLEIAIIDAARGHGNSYLLPAGPLREPKKRLDKVNLVVVHSQKPTGENSFSLKPGAFVNLSDSSLYTDVKGLTELPIHAIAGIGHPERFFNTLRDLGLNFTEHTFSDHHMFSPADFNTLSGVILMTEKDALKCMNMSLTNAWYLPVDVEVTSSLKSNLEGLLSDLRSRYPNK